MFALDLSVSTTGGFFVFESAIVGFGEENLDFDSTTGLDGSLFGFVDTTGLSAGLGEENLGFDSTIGFEGSDFGLVLTTGLSAGFGEENFGLEDSDFGLVLTTGLSAGFGEENFGFEEELLGCCFDVLGDENLGFEEELDFEEDELDFELLLFWAKVVTGIKTNEAKTRLISAVLPNFIKNPPWQGLEQKSYNGKTVFANTLPQPYYTFDFTDVKLD